MNYKMQNVIQGFFSGKKKMYHKYKFEGKEHILTPFDTDEQDPRLLQSFANYCKKNTPPSDGNGGGGSGNGTGIEGDENEGESTAESSGENLDIDNIEIPESGEAKEAVQSDLYSKAFNEPSKKKTPVGLRDEDASMRGEVKMPANISSSQLNDIKLIQRELTRISEVRTKKKEKLNMPKVFEALLSQPHTALEKKKNKEVIIRNLIVFVDTSVGYHQQIHNCDVSLHNSIIYACKTLPFVDLFYADGMYGFNWKENNWKGIKETLKKLDEIYKQKKKKMHKILVLTQGCGDSSLDQYKGYEHLVEFLTPFAEGCNCGCRRIQHAKYQGCNMHYSVLNANYLKTL